jgi:hypothetical protein
MRPITLSIVPRAASTTYFASGLTGKGPFRPAFPPIATSNLGYTTTLTSTADLSAISFIVNGTDQSGLTINETITGPNNTTVTTTNYFKFINLITASATLGANTLDVGNSATAAAEIIPINYLQSSFSCTIGVAVTGTINYTVEYTESAIYDIATSAITWLALSALTSKTANADGSITSPFRALRFTINSFTPGATATVNVIQTRG